MASARLTIADQVLVWSAYALAGPHRDAGDAKMFGAIIADVLPHVAMGNPQVASVARAAQGVIGGCGAGDELELDRALKGFARWRAGLSYDAFAAQAEGGKA